MRRFWLFRSDLTSLEYYHSFRDLNTFVKHCHDYYMLLPLWLLEANYFDEVMIWRLSKQNKEPIIFDVNGKQYIQRWCKNFNHTLFYPSPDISFWRGGFRLYDEITKAKSKYFGYKIYLGAGQRISARWGGKYDLFLMEDNDDIRKNPGTYPFYKTASPFIFFPFKTDTDTYNYDICWPCNFTQLKYKGQEEFIKTISKSGKLRSLKIVHCGNKPEVGKRLCNQYNVSNIEFKGPMDRPQLNHILNYSKFGLNLSNRLDGCPRVSTEVLMSGTPLIIHERTRLLSYYKQRGVVVVNNSNIEEKIMKGMKKHKKIEKQVLEALKDELAFDKTNEKNIELWKSLAKI
jgi:hypothetical protein